jgi:glycerol-1-phosphate dehydrogenase [NAD(P)+]
MYVAGSSVPASGAEHMLAHYMELMHPETQFSFHGEQIAVCTIAMARLQEDILKHNKFSLRDYDEDLIRKHFAATGQSGYFMEEAKQKFRISTLPHIEAAQFQPPSAEAIEEKLSAIGAPTRPEQLGWSHNIFEDAIKFAAFTRNRVTFLDINN